MSKNGDKEGDDAPQHTRIEYAYHLMAKDAGIGMNECRLYEEKGRYHFMTRRFDRDPLTGGKWHMQSLGAMAHFDFNQPRRSANFTAGWCSTYLPEIRTTM